MRAVRGILRGLGALGALVVIALAPVAAGAQGLEVKGGLSAEARYVYGLTDLDHSTIGSSGSYQSRAFMLLLGSGF